MNDRIFNKDQRKDFQETVLNMCIDNKSISEDDISDIKDYFNDIDDSTDMFFEYKIFLRSIKNDLPRTLYNMVDVQRRNESYVMYKTFDPTLGGRILVMVFNKD